MDPKTMHPATQNSTPADQPDTTTAFFRLEHLAVLDISGSDALTFLQGQGTQEYLKQLPQQPLPGAFCTAKGRVVANVWNVLVASDPATVKLVVHRSSAEPLRQHLAKYIPFFRGSKLTDESQTHHGVGLSGTDNHRWLTQSLGDPELGVWRKGEHFAFVLPDGRCQLWLADTEDDFESLMARIEAAGIQASSHWQRLDILAGYPWVDASHTAEFVPQVIGLDRLHGISFDKGCYTGQEVIARLHYKGQSKRSLQRLAWQGSASPATSALYSEKGVGGTWVNWVTDGEHRLGLAIIKQTEPPQSLYLDADRQILLNLLD
jgi:folate-binding protein YgfZ